jgi:cysteine synthase A
MVAIKYKFNGKIYTIYSKCEYYNYTGSVKDRMALHILESAFSQGKLNSETTIVEATSGNTGIAFAALGCYLGLKVKIIMPDWMSDERKNIIKSFGAELMQVSREQDGFVGSIRLAESIHREEVNMFLPCQFSNIDNVKAHETTTSVEILMQLSQQNLQPTAFVAGVGTGGTVIGVGRTLKSKFPKCTIHPLEPLESPTITTGYKVGEHRIQGISDEFVPRIMDYDTWNDVIAVSDGDAILMTQKIAKTLGLGVGISSGANFLGAVILAEKYGIDSVVSTIFPDDNKKYLTTDYVKTEIVKETYLTPNIEILEMTTFDNVDIYK